MSLQERFDSQASGDFVLPPGEAEGPLVVRRPCVVEGNGSTLWAKKGPVLVVESGGVTVRNLRIELTEQAAAREERTALKTSHGDTRLENVEVSGDVWGFSGEAEVWNLPRIINLGSFAPDCVNSIALKIDSPAQAEIVCGIKGTKITPQTLAKGNNTILLELAPLKDNTIIYGEVFIKSLVSRRIYITGRAEVGAQEDHDTLSSALKAERGQRVSLKDFQAKTIRIEYVHQKTKRDFELDAYVFKLGSNGRVRRDEDMIFWGNMDTCPAIRIQKANECPSVSVSLGQIESWTERIAVCLSIYGDNPAQNFSLSVEPSIRVYADDEELSTFSLDNLNLEKTITAIELYRYHNEWRINFVGAGFNKGLKRLCENFGVEVE